MQEQESEFEIRAGPLTDMRDILLIATTPIEIPSTNRWYNSKPTNILWWSETDWMSFRSGLLILLVQLDGLVSFSADQA